LGLPPEILAGHAADIIDYYLRTQSSARALREVKLIMVGRGEVGKTSLVETLKGKPFQPGMQKTEGIAITRWNLALADGNATAVVWDFGGQEILHGTHQFFLTHRSIYVLVLTGRSNLQNTDAEYWLSLIRAFGGQSPVLIVMNKQCLEPFDTDRNVIVRKYGISLNNFHRTDCTNPETINELKDGIRKEMLKMLSPPEFFPAEWWKIKSRLESMSQKGEEYLSDERYRQICVDYGVVPGEKDVPAILLQRLTDLGSVVSFPNEIRLNELTVLNPEWVTDGIYRILSNKELKSAAHGQVDTSKLGKYLPAQRWPFQRHRYLIDLMAKFELCFPLEGLQDVVLIPELLPDAEPELPNWHAEQCLVFTYKYGVLPQGILPRFITRTHTLSEGQPRWRKGVILSEPQHSVSALVRADYELNEVSVFVRGTDPSAKRHLLSVIRYHFEELHGRVKGLEVTELVSVPGHPETRESYRNLILDEDAGEERIRVTIDDRRVWWSVSNILDGIEDRSDRAKRVRRDSSPGPVTIIGQTVEIIEGGKTQLDVEGGTFYGPVSGQSKPAQ
jgi:internalin A